MEWALGSPILEEDDGIRGGSSDDDDPVERNEYDVETNIDPFDEDPPIQHNVYPDTDSDSEEVYGRRRNKGYQRRGKASELFLGQTFFNGVAFKDCVLDYALETKANIQQVRFDKTKLAFKCIEKNCRWRIYCSLTSKNALWKVSRYNEAHCCVPNGNCYMFKVPQIARVFLDNLREEPEDYMPKTIEEKVMSTWGISVTRNQCQKARMKGLRWIEIEHDEQFRRLRDYANEIVESNPGSTVEVDCETNEAGEDVFKRFYVCFEVLRRSWIGTCRPVIGIDGAFMRGKMKGQVLAAIGRDADNRIYPIAWGVVGVEDADNWAWFIKKLRADLRLGQGAGAILVSDRQKGLIKAVSSELPEIEHRHCVRHIYGNVKSRHGKKTKLKTLIWNLAWSYNSVEYSENLDKLANYDSEVYKDVLEQNPKSWCRAFYKIEGNHCEDVENNSVESFNRSIDKAREKSFVPMLETIRRLAMVRIAKRSTKSAKHDGICTPYVMEFLSLEEKKANNCKVKPSTNGCYEVILSGCSYRVHLEDRTCSCKKWEITGIPCEHAYGVILHKRLSVEDYVSRWLLTAKWRNTYDGGINPLRGSKFWPRSGKPVHEPPFLDKKNKIEKRKKGRSESPQKKTSVAAKRTMHCGVCGAPGHNKRFHEPKKKKQKVDESRGSQPDISGLQTPD